jgi:Domain of unknown function (DUF4265)
MVSSMAENSTIITHTIPLWREKANYLKVVKLRSQSFGYLEEQLWLKKLGDDKYEICCIPFLVYDFCLGDIVTFKENNEWLELVESQKQYSFRVLLKHEGAPAVIILDSLRPLVARLDFELDQTVPLLAISVSKSDAQSVANALATMKSEGVIAEFETARLVDV